MKHLKTYESKNNLFRCAIYIKNENHKKIVDATKKLIEWFPTFRFQSKLIDITDTPIKYLKLNLNEYNFIEVSKTYTFLDDDNEVDDDSININIVLMSDTKEEFIENIEMSKKSNQYNL